jgi:hypothetical protein
VDWSRQIVPPGDFALWAQFHDVADQQKDAVGAIAWSEGTTTTTDPADQARRSFLQRRIAIVKAV